MHLIRFHADRRAGRRAWSLAPLIVVAAVCCCVSGCGAGIAGSASGAATGANHQPHRASIVLDSGTPTGQAQGTTAVGLGAPGAAVADWLHKVAAGDRGGACADMRQPGLSPSGSTAACMSAAGKGTFDSLHSAFVSYGIRPDTPISVDGVQAGGTSTTVSAGQIRVSGKTLDSLMLAHSAGVQPGQVSMSFQLSRIDRSWYVTGMNLSA